MSIISTFPLYDIQTIHQLLDIIWINIFVQKKELFKLSKRLSFKPWGIQTNHVAIFQQF